MYESSRKEIKINESTFFVRRFPAFMALEVLGDLQARFLQPLLPALEAANGDKDELYNAVIQGVGQVSKTLSGKELVALARLLLNGEYVSACAPGVHPSDAEKLTENLYNAVFNGPEDVIALCIEIGKLNFAPAFSNLLSRFGQAQ